LKRSIKWLCTKGEAGKNLHSKPEYIETNENIEIYTIVSAFSREINGISASSRKYQRKSVAK
jgi:hypothetical protein